MFLSLERVTGKGENQKAAKQYKAWDFKGFFSASL
jgi:hypothetical protein